MAGITGYTRTHNGRARVIRIGILKTFSGMTVTALRIGVRVRTGWRIVDSRRHTCGYGPVVATGAYAVDA